MNGFYYTCICMSASIQICHSHAFTCTSTSYWSVCLNTVLSSVIKNEMLIEIFFVLFQKIMCFIVPTKAQ